MAAELSPSSARFPGTGWVGPDRVGLAWRDELAADIYLHLDRIDHLEILADREWRASSRRLDALRELARQVPVSLHGVGLGLASSGAVATERLERMARLVGRIEPDHWSEHLAFVRAGNHEIGHLAQAPRNERTLAGTFENVRRAARVVGTAPHLENIATLIVPPGSALSEGEFVTAAMRGTGAPLLLDLHNLYANAVNFGDDPLELLTTYPLASVKTVHVSGGLIVDSPLGLRRLIDDHLHGPPAAVYDLLKALAARTPQPLTVILERDGAFPAFGELLDELGVIREALASGRAERHASDLLEAA